MILEGDCDVDGYETIDQGLSAVETHFYDVAILDLNFEGDSRSGLERYFPKDPCQWIAETDVIVTSGETDDRKLVRNIQRWCRAVCSEDVQCR
jgi:DNA-binding NarL/FixJ family response regulator